MDDFGTLTVVFQSPNVDTVTTPVPLTRRSKLWRKITRKPIPSITQEIPSFYTVDLDSDNDPDDFEEQAKTLESVGYTIVSAIVDDSYSTEELARQYHMPDAADISVLFRSLIEDGYRADAYVAYVLEYGWDADNLTSDWMDDHYHGGWNSAAHYVQDLVSDCWHDSIKNIPDFVDINWEGTADNLRTDYDFVRYYGNIHVFSNN